RANEGDECNRALPHSSARWARRSARENEGCAYTVISYNSCRDRHCPKCQAAASREWLAEREAELLPVGYFHVVFSLPSEIAAIGRDNPDNRRRSQTAWRQDRYHLSAAHLGFDDDPPSACAHDRAGRWPVARRQALGCGAAQVPAAGEGAL